MVARNKRKTKTKQEKKTKQVKKEAEKAKVAQPTPFDNCNTQPFNEYMMQMKEAHDIGHLLWMLNTGKLGIPHHTHPKGALNLKLPFNLVEDQYVNSNPNIVVIDDFMDAEALVKLKNYCQEFPFWNTIYGRGYFGAFRESGFTPQILETLALEMIENMPKVFNNSNKRNLAQMWAFKYEPKCPGIDIHADFAAINVNFWITHTQANKDYDPENDVGKTGGMWLWDKGAPPDWDFVRYNGDDKTEVLEYLKDAGAIYIPYKYNRCVMFDSNLFHKTADVNFYPGWDNRRVNVTMLFGRREADEGVEPTDMLESKKMYKKTTKSILEQMQEDNEVSTEDFTNVKVSP